MSLSLFMTETCTHKRPDGSGGFTSIQTGVVCTPPDPMTTTPGIDYPFEKLFMMREFYTKYANFVAGDYATFGANNYAVRAVQPWEGMGALDTFYRIIIEVMG